MSSNSLILGITFVVLLSTLCHGADLSKSCMYYGARFPNPALWEMERTEMKIQGETVKLPPPSIRDMIPISPYSIAAWGEKAVMMQEPQPQLYKHHVEKHKSWKKYVQLRPLLVDAFDGWWIVVHWNVSTLFQPFMHEYDARQYIKKQRKEYGIRGYYHDCVGRELVRQTVFMNFGFSKVVGVPFGSATIDEVIDTPYFNDILKTYFDSANILVDGSHNGSQYKQVVAMVDSGAGCCSVPSQILEDIMYLSDEDEVVINIYGVKEQFLSIAVPLLWQYHGLTTCALTLPTQAFVIGGAIIERYQITFNKTNNPAIIANPNPNEIDHTVETSPYMWLGSFKKAHW